MNGIPSIEQIHAALYASFAPVPADMAASADNGYAIGDRVVSTLQGDMWRNRAGIVPNATAGAVVSVNGDNVAVDWGRGVFSFCPLDTIAPMPSNSLSEVDAADRAARTVRGSILGITRSAEILTDYGYQSVDELFTSQERIMAVTDNRAQGTGFRSSGLSHVKSTKAFRTGELAEIFELETAEGFILRAAEWQNLPVVRDGLLLRVVLGGVEAGDQVLIGSGQRSSHILPSLTGESLADGPFLSQPQYRDARDRGASEAELRSLHLSAAAHGETLTMRDVAEARESDRPVFTPAASNGFATVTSVTADGVEDVYGVAVYGGRSTIANGIVIGGDS